MFNCKKKLYFQFLNHKPNIDIKRNILFYTIRDNLDKNLRFPKISQPLWIRHCSISTQLLMFIFVRR